MSSFLGLRTVIYQVPDLAKAKAWYSRVFGTDPYFDEPFYVGYSVSGFELGLHPLESNVVPGSGGVTAYWGVSDVKLVYDTLLAAGATSAEEPTEVGGGIMVATVKDPWGNLLGIIYNPHFKREEVR